MLQGANIHFDGAAEDPVDYDTTTVFDIVVPSGGLQFNFQYLIGETNTPATGRGMTIDWGDGTVFTYTNLVNSVYYGYNPPTTTATKYSPERCIHRYERAGNYRIKLWGDIRAVTPWTAANDDGLITANYIKRASWRHIEGAATALLPCQQSTTALAQYLICEDFDISRVYITGDTTKRTVGALLNNGLIQVLAYHFPHIEYMSSSFMRGNLHTTDVYFMANTMQSFYDFKTSASGTTLWNFTNLPTAVTIHCSDGDIKNVDGTWTKFPGGA